MTFQKIPAKISVRIANASVDVPIYHDEKTTRDIADTITQRIFEIQESYGRVDSHAFALRAAFELAVELDQARRNAEHESRDIIVALDELMTRLKDLLENNYSD